MKNGDGRALAQIEALGYTADDALRRLLSIIRAHLRATGERKTHFGRRVLKDSKFVDNLILGRRVSMPLVAKVFAAIGRKQL